MTRDERLALAEQRLKEKRAADQAALDKVYAQQRELARKARTRRRSAVGMLADEAGLLAWDDGILSALFMALATLAEVANPVAVLESLLTENEAAAVGACADPEHSPSAITQMSVTLADGAKKTAPWRS
jgi:hypothetical protein